MKLSKILSATLLFTGLGIFLTYCTKDDPLVQAPQITGVTPDSAYVADTVIIAGTNFSTTTADNTVHFNGSQAVVLKATSTSITTVVPDGATTGKVTVTIHNTSASTQNDFIILRKAITSFSPSSGIAGSSVVIVGSGFSTTPSSNVVKFNGVAATILTSTATAITATVPNGATTGKITVAVTGSNVILTSASDFIVPVPTITSFAPIHGIPGTNIIIAGTNFNSGNLSGNTVTINGTPASVTAATSTQLTVAIPVLATSGKISINVGGQSVNSISDFEVLKDIPREGLVAFYPFNGNAEDTSGNNLDGTAMGSPVSASDRFGMAGQAYAFDGVDDYITMGNPTALQISNKLTVAGWFNMNNTGVNSMMGLIVKIYFDPTAGNNPKRGYYISEDGNLSSPYLHTISYTADGQNFAVNQTSTISTPGTWMFLAFVTDGTSWSLYRDGISNTVSGTSANGNANPDGSLGDFVIGAYDGGFLFKGNADDVTIYNRALSSDEVNQLYTQTVSKY